jgi:hypothetical protein
MASSGQKDGIRGSLGHALALGSGRWPQRSGPMWGNHTTRRADRPRPHSRARPVGSPRGAKAPRQRWARARNEIPLCVHCAVPFGARVREATTLIAGWVAKVRPERSPWPAAAAFGATKSVRVGAGIYPIRHTHALDTAGRHATCLSKTGDFGWWHRHLSSGCCRASSGRR